MNEKPVIYKKTCVWPWFVGVTLCVFLLLVVMVILTGGGFVFIIETPIRFFIGWVPHAFKILPSFSANPRSFLLPIGCLILAGILLHRFIQRSLASKTPRLVWRSKDTIFSLLLLLSGCAAAIALSGVVHQAVWLMSGRVIENHGKRSELTYAVGNARQLMLALLEFHEAKQRYPYSLQEVTTEFDMQPRVTQVEPEDSDILEPFILLYPGRTRVADGKEPVIVSPVITKDGKIVVGYGDMSVRSIPGSRLGEIIESRRIDDPQPSESR